VKIHIFRALDCPSSISGWQVMAKKHKVINPLEQGYSII